MNGFGRYPTLPIAHDSSTLSPYDPGYTDLEPSGYELNIEGSHQQLGVPVNWRVPSQDYYNSRDCYENRGFRPPTRKISQKFKGFC